MRRLLLIATIFCVATPAAALDLNSFRAQHKLPPLSYSADLASAAYGHAHDLARRKALDHKGFKTRVGSIVSGRAAENVLVGCPDEDCAYRKWAASPGHRRNMLMKGLSAYGLASATGDDGRKYWVLELGN